MKNQLRLVKEVRYDQKVRSWRDNRNIVNRVLVEYEDVETSEPYRKSFEAKGKKPTYPEVGTHEQLNALKYQW